MEGTTIELCKEILSYVIPVLSIFISFFLGRRQTIQTHKRQILLQRYEELYIPFIRWIYIYRPWSRAFTEMTQESRSSVLSVLLNNIDHMDNGSIELLQELYFSNIVFDTPATEPFEEFLNTAAKDEVNTTFCRLSYCMLLHSLELSKKLYKPPIAENALAKFAELNSIKENTSSKPC